MSRACALGGPSCSSISAGSRRTIQFAYLQQDTGSCQDELCSIHAIGNEGPYSPGTTRYLKCEKLGPFQYLVPSTSSVGHVSESLSLNIVEEALDCHRINVLLVNVRTFRDELRPCGNNCLPKYCDLFILREPNLNIACGLRRSRASFRIYAGQPLWLVKQPRHFMEKDLLRVTRVSLWFPVWCSPWLEVLFIVSLAMPLVIPLSVITTFLAVGVCAIVKFDISASC